MRPALLVLALTLLPTSVAACAVCLDSAYGNRSFNWAFALFMLTPFAVAAALAAVLARLRAPALPAHSLGEVSEGRADGPVGAARAPSEERQVASC